LFIDHDVLELIREFQEIKAVEREIRVELVGLNPKYKIDNTLNHQFVFTEGAETEPSLIVNAPPRRRHRELLGKLLGKTNALEA